MFKKIRKQQVQIEVLRGADQTPYRVGDPDPDLRVCHHRQGGMIKLYDGVPVVFMTDRAAYHLVELKEHLDWHLQHAQGARDFETRNKDWKLLEDIRSASWWWYSATLGPEAFYTQRTAVIAREWETDQKSLEQKFSEDIKKGKEEIGNVYPEFICTA